MRVLTPQVVWNIELPQEKGKFYYVPKSPILIDPGDAITIVLRLFVIHEGGPTPPIEVATYSLKFRFVSANCLKAETSEISISE